MSYYKQAYFTFLPIAFTVTSMFGIIKGIDHGMNTKNPIESFSRMVGCTSIGMITGLLYPISFPVLAGYTMLQNPKKEE